MNGSLYLHRWAGQGDPIVVVHGIDGSGGSWGLVADLLDGGSALVAPDLRGRGLSSSDEPFGIAAHASDMIQIIRGIASGPVLLVGHSFGAHVAARVAADEPDLIGHLVLVDGGPPREIPVGTSPATVAESALANIVPNLTHQLVGGATPFSLLSEPSHTTRLARVLVTAGPNMIRSSCHLIRPRPASPQSMTSCLQGR